MGITRRLLFITSGVAPADAWQQAAREEAPVRGKPRACAECPLRIGGEWEAGATAALAYMPEPARAKMKRWGCHAEDRPCAGMRRLLNDAAKNAV